jgi:UDP-N-acetylmuramoyl-L-alanyl-D-glutamate--2,6-diaminopimelate ligase
MVTAGMGACAIEASSIGLAEHRLDGTQVRVALFTNFTQDHLDYHGDMDQYCQAKSSLFSWSGLQSAVINVDDAKGAALAAQLNEEGACSVWTVSCDASFAQRMSALPTQHLQACHITHGQLGLSFDVTEGAASHHLDTRLVGLYNVSNVLGVLACLRALGHSLADAVRACADLPAVPGRMQAVTADGAPLVVIDYAHTPDAVTQAVQALLPLAQSRGGQVTCVLGCGGDRDSAKRPVMAAAAERFAQQVVLTSDNPRSESPEAILNSMWMGLQHADRATVIVDRAQAIAHAVASAKSEDVVLVAGKGHEDYQEVMGVKHPFSDVAHAQAALASRSAHV